MPSVRKSYDEELLQLDTLLARMGHEAGAAIESALTALRNDDIELARSVVARDSQIDASDHEIEHRCLQLLLRQQPASIEDRVASMFIRYHFLSAAPAAGPQPAERRSAAKATPPARPARR